MSPIFRIFLLVTFVTLATEARAQGGVTLPLTPRQYDEALPRLKAACGGALYEQQIKDGNGDFYDRYREYTRENHLEWRRGALNGIQNDEAMHSRDPSYHLLRISGFKFAVCVHNFFLGLTSGDFKSQRNTSSETTTGEHAAENGAGGRSTIGTGRQETSQPVTRTETPPNTASNNRSTPGTSTRDRSGTRDGTEGDGLPKLVKNAKGEMVLPPIAGQPASECAAINPKPGLYGGFINKCAFRINISYCAYKPKKFAWNALFDCEKGGGGLDDIKANATRAAHTNGTYMYWFACKYPSTPAGLRFVPGQGLRGRCG